MRYTYTITVGGIGIEVYYSYKEASERWRQLILEQPPETCTVVVGQEDYDEEVYYDDRDYDVEWESENERI